MLGVPEQEYVPSTIEKVLTYAVIGSSYAFSALRYGWIPLCVVLGGTSIYCEPAFSIDRWLGVSAARQPQ